jgi:LemA protein
MQIYTIFIILACVIMVVIAFIWSAYNSIVKLNERVNEAWSDITVQLKYRADLIPNVVETVKAYAKHESKVFKEVTEARAASLSAKDVKSAANAEKAMQSALGQIYAVAESYPELKSNSNFEKLQQQLQDVEDKIQAARRFYNNGAQELNTKIKLFPINLFNGFGFKSREYFEVDAAEKAKIDNAPEVKFDN